MPFDQTASWNPPRRVIVTLIDLPEYRQSMGGNFIVWNNTEQNYLMDGAPLNAGWEVVTQEKPVITSTNHHPVQVYEWDHGETRQPS